MSAEWPETVPFGGNLRIVAPAAAVDETVLQPGIQWLGSQGWRVSLGHSLYDRHRYLAGTDLLRAADMNAAIADVDVHAVVAARGGYGCARLLEAIDWDAWSRRKIPFVGFSDLTAFQLALYRRCGLISYSGFAPAADCRPGRPVEPVVAASLSALLTERSMRPISGLRVVKAGRAEGPLLGGCLSLVTTLLGTDWLPDLTGAILVLEDVGEHPYRIDRMLNQLRQAGVWDAVAGVVFGQFFRCSDPNGYFDELYREVADLVDGPVVADAPYGHQPSRQVLPIGAHVTLMAEADSHGILAMGSTQSSPPATSNR